MANQVEYVTIILNRNSSGDPFVQAAQNREIGALLQGQEAEEALNQLGRRGWHLVTSINFPSDERPRLIFMRSLDKKEE